MNQDERIADLERQVACLTRDLADAAESRKWDLVAAQHRLRSQEIAENGRTAAETRAHNLEELLREFLHAAERAVGAASTGRFSPQEMVVYNDKVKAVQVALGEDDE